MPVPPTEYTFWENILREQSLAQKTHVSVLNQIESLARGDNMLSKAYSFVVVVFLMSSYWL